MRLTPTVVRVSRLETAEVIKLVDNTSRDVMFGFANEVARTCDAIGISAAEVIASGKLGYPRTNLPIPGPVGGPCLSKDSIILAEGLEPFGIVPEIAATARRVNERLPHETVGAVARTLRQQHGFPQAPVVALLGMAFKGRPITDDLRQTMAIPVLHVLRAEWPAAEFRLFDPVVPLAKLRQFAGTPCADLGSALSGAHLGVVLNNHPLFGSEQLVEIADRMARPGLIYDFWNHFSMRDTEFPQGIGYMALGSHARYRIRA
jgi:UDP-N-acetyl-D-mannosaminuronic acid dehydrogenase